MSLKDLQRNGRPIQGAFGNGLPIIGQKIKTNAWQQIGLLSLTPPEPSKDPNDPEASAPNPNYIVRFAGQRSDGQGVVTAVDITPAMIAIGPQAIVEAIGRGLNFLQTYRDCTCPQGLRCRAHMPAVTDAAPVETPTSEASDMETVRASLIDPSGEQQ